MVSRDDQDHNLFLMDPCTGRGWAVVEGDKLHGMIFFHQGDGSSFVAKRAPKRPRPKRK